MRLSRSYTSDGTHRIAYHRAGNGPPILLLHGLGGSADFWQPLIATLASSYTLIVPDLLGFGFSDKPDDVVYTPARHSQAVCAVLAAANLGALDTVIGHSCGGVIAVTLLASGAIATTRLGLAATPYPSPRFPVRTELLHSPLDRAMLTWRPVARTLHRVIMLLWPLVSRLSVPPELRGAWVGYMDHTIQSYVGTAEECLFRANLDPLLPALRALPTLLLYSPADHTVPLIHGKRLNEQLPQSVLCVVDDNHYAVLRKGMPPLIHWLAASAHGVHSIQ